MGAKGRLKRALERQRDPLSKRAGLIGRPQGSKSRWLVYSRHPTWGLIPQGLVAKWQFPVPPFLTIGQSRNSSMPHSFPKNIGIPIRDKCRLDPQQKPYIKVQLRIVLNLFSYVIDCTLFPNLFSCVMLQTHRFLSQIVSITAPLWFQTWDSRSSSSWAPHKDHQCRYQHPRGNDGQPTWSLNGRGMAGTCNHLHTTLLCVCAVTWHVSDTGKNEKFQVWSPPRLWGSWAWPRPDQASLQDSWKEVLKWKSEENPHTLIGIATYITHIRPHLLLSHHTSGSHNSTIEQKH